MDFGIAGHVTITVICWLVSEAVKVFGIDKKYIPVICGAFGCALGIIGMWIVPEFPANDLFSAMAVGIVSGLAATGAHQTYKQLKG